jgi:hypothetical protein
VTELTRLKERSQRLSALVEAGPGPSEKDLLLELKSRRARFEGMNEEGYGTSHDDFRVLLFTERDLAAFAKSTREIAARIIALSNELAEINGSTQITLGDPRVTYLKEESLI